MPKRSSIAPVDFRDTPEEARFRDEVRSWLDANLPDELRGHGGGAARFDGPEVRAWSRALYDGGWVGISWPEEYGGRGLSPRFQAIYLEEEARVEVPLDNVIGDVGGGWDVAMTTLLHERGTLGFALVARLEVQVQKLLALAADRGATPTQREGLAREWIHLQAVRVTAYRSLSALERTGIPGPEGSILKLQWSEANQRLTKLALELLGPEAQLRGEGAHLGGYWQHQQLRSRGNTIEAGTSEILRNIIAERVLGLPRSR
jgi:alkylation response protein AidB-like acyl-CoA dehydrogenase